MNTVTIVSNCARVFVTFGWEGKVDYSNLEQGIINDYVELIISLPVPHRRTHPLKLEKPSVIVFTDHQLLLSWFLDMSLKYSWGQSLQSNSVEICKHCDLADKSTSTRWLLPFIVNASCNVKYAVSTLCVLLCPRDCVGSTWSSRLQLSCLHTRVVYAENTKNFNQVLPCGKWYPRRKQTTSL